MNTLMLVSGGDAPGINAAFYHYARAAARDGKAVYGARGGFAGLLNGEVSLLKPEAAAPWAGVGGSLLESSREPVLSSQDAEQRLKVRLDERGIKGLVLFGGDGSLRHIPPLLEAWGVPCIGIPTTIDNDVAGTELTLGFDSACNFAYHVIDGMRATAHALPGRIFTLETLGGDTGFLALAVADGAGADAVLLPEYDYDENWLAERLREAAWSRGHALLVMSEGVKTKETVVANIPQWTGIRVRDTRLGHAQRGGAPSHRDRVLAAEMARVAYASLCDGVRAGMVVVRGGRTMLHEGVLAGAPQAAPDRVLYDFINGLSSDGHSGN